MIMPMNTRSHSPRLRFNLNVALDISYLLCHFRKKVAQALRLRVVADAKMKRLWKKLRAWAVGGLEQRITAAGFAFTVLIGVVGAAAFISANNLLFLVLAALLATLLMSGFVNRLLLAGLELEFLLPEHISARQKSSARILVRNRKRAVPSFSIHLTGTTRSGFQGELYFPLLPGNSTAEQTVNVLFEKRGLYEENSFSFSSRFPFGFAERRIHVMLRRPVLVYPAIDPQPGFENLLQELTGEIAAHFRGRGGDFYRIRPYEALESSRHVDWRATAHTGELQVREFAREQEHRIEIVLDLDTAADDRFEHAIECCAYLILHLSQRGARVRMRTQAFDASIPEQGDVYTILKYLALVAPLPGRPPVVPDDDKSFALVFTSSPARMLDAGWDRARMFDLAADGPTGVPSED
jgi:uncharacterized protein (DUF58 family)